MSQNMTEPPCRDNWHALAHRIGLQDSETTLAVNAGDAWLSRDVAIHAFIGQVISRRKHGKNLVFLDVVFDCGQHYQTDIQSLETRREEMVQVILNKKDFLQFRHLESEHIIEKSKVDNLSIPMNLTFDVVESLAVAGTVWAFSGRIQLTKKKELSIGATTAALIKIPCNVPMILRFARILFQHDPNQLSGQLLHSALLGQFAAPPGVVDSRPMRRNSTLLKVSSSIFESTYATCQRIIYLVKLDRTNVKVSTRTHVLLNNESTKMCRLLSGKCETRCRGHRLNPKEKLIMSCSHRDMSQIEKAANGWISLSRKKVSNSRTDTRMTVDLLRSLGVHPEQNLASFSVNDHESDTLTDQKQPINENEDAEEDFQRLQQRLQYCREKKAPQIVWILQHLTDFFGLQSTELQNEICHENADSGEDWSSQVPARQSYVRHKKSTESSMMHIWDIGGGRGDLAVAVGMVFGSRVIVHVVDVNEASLEIGCKFAASLGLDNVVFTVADMTQLDLETSQSCTCSKGPAGTLEAPSTRRQTDHLCRKCDLLIGLHVCGGLTDLLVATSERIQAPFIVVPCCYYKYPDLRLMFTSTLKVKVALFDVLGDNLMTQLIKDLKSNFLAEERVIKTDSEYYDFIYDIIFRLAESPTEKISYLATEAVARLRVKTYLTLSSLDLFLERFPNEFSQKNLMIVKLYRSGT